jgi:alcohol dehydrogenase (cytochrome c)
VGNPGPDWNGDVRPGDNLYSDCVLALDANTGKIKWHYQFTPHDVWDWDACQIPVLVDREFRGEQRKLMLFGNRNGFFYVLDRESGEFLLAKAFAKQTWAEGFDKKGRPKIIPEKIPTEQGVMVFPEATGAANWWSPSYSPQTRLFYQMSFDGGAKFYKGEAIYREGTPYLGGMPDRSAFFVEAPDPNVMSAVRAIDPNTGERVWQYQVQAMSSSGLLTTKSNLLFGGTAKGVFFALDATSGKELWKLDLGARVHAAPVTYLLDGKQYVTIAAGSALFTFAL